MLKEERENKMAYEVLDDVTSVKLGGTDKKTGKKNPTQLEGYYLRKETRPNKFNPEKPQNFYVFMTSSGQIGTYSTAGIDREMKKATIGVMTLLKDTGEVLDTGKGNPMRVFQVAQDKSNVLDAESLASSNIVPEEDYEGQQDELSEIDAEDDEAVEEMPAPRPVAPKVPAKTPSSEQQAKIQALLNKNRK